MLIIYPMLLFQRTINAYNIFFACFRKKNKKKHENVFILNFIVDSENEMSEKMKGKKLFSKPVFH